MGMCECMFFACLSACESQEVTSKAYALTSKLRTLHSSCTGSDQMILRAAWHALGRSGHSLPPHNAGITSSALGSCIL